MKRPVAIIALPLASFFAGPAFAQGMCIVEGVRPIMGANMTAAFDVSAGQGCKSDISPQGSIRTSEVSQHAQHGTVKMIDKDTWTYEPAAGYHGSDSFAITAQGQSIDEKPGTSVLSFTVNVK